MIYLDNNASTKLDPAARAAFERALDLHGNPSSLHAAGRMARKAVEEARAEVASLVGAAPAEIFFTSGGTEANAMAIQGVTADRSGDIVRSGAEHPSVREPVDISGKGAVRVVDPGRSGVLDAEAFVAAILPGTLLVSAMLANNEYGALFPVAAIARGARERGALSHTDAVQAAGRIPIDVEALGVDLLTLSAHKLHGPRGVGALFVRRGVRIVPRTPGGGQEKRLRGGTENTPAIVGFGVAARLARERLESDAPAIASLRDRLERGIAARIPDAWPVGAGAPRLSNTSAIHFRGARAETVLVRLDLEGIAVSAGSACSSGTLQPSPAILALGLTAAEAREVVRFSLSRETSEAEIDRLLEVLPAVVEGVRAAAAPETGRIPRSGGAAAAAGSSPAAATEASS